MIKVNNMSASPITVSNGNDLDKAKIVHPSDYLHEQICEAITQSQIERLPIHECLADITVDDGRYLVKDKDESLLAIVESRNGHHTILPAKEMQRFKGIRLVNESTSSLLLQLTNLLLGGAE